VSGVPPIRGGFDFREIQRTEYRKQMTDDKRQRLETRNLEHISFLFFEYRISNPPEAEMMKFSLPSIFNILNWIFYGSLFSDI